MITSKEIQTQIQYASRVVGSWPAWKQNILSHSSQPTNSVARAPIDNHTKNFSEMSTFPIANVSDVVIMDSVRQTQQQTKGEKMFTSLQAIFENTEMMFIGDSHHKGTNFYWQERLERWVVVDLENREVSFHERLALVRCNDADKGLNQNCLGSDLDGPGLWLVDAEYVEECEEGYLHDVCEVRRM